MLVYVHFSLCHRKKWISIKMPSLWSIHNPLPPITTVWAVIQEAHSQEAGCAASAATSSLKNGAADQQKKSCARCDTDFGWYSRQFACQRCGQRFCKRCIGQKPQQKMCLDCVRTASGIRSKSEGVSISQARRNLLQISASTEEGIIKASYITFRGQSGKQLQRFFVLRQDFCLYSYRNDKDHCALAMLPLSGCDIGVHAHEKNGITMKHINRAYLIICTNESEHAEWLAALLLSANAKLPGEYLAKKEGEEDEMDGGMKKSATIGFTTGHSIRQNEAAQKPKNSFASLNPLSSIIRRSASMGDQRLDQVEMAMARERVRELNAHNAAANQLKQLKFQQMQRDCADENGTTFRF